MVFQKEHLEYPALTIKTSYLENKSASMTNMVTTVFYNYLVFQEAYFYTYQY